MGTCASEQQDYTSAIDFYERALLLCRSQVDGGDKAACQMNMGTVSVHVQVCLWLKGECMQGSGAGAIAFEGRACQRASIPVSCWQAFERSKWQECANH